MDACRAGKAWVSDNPHLKLIYIIINHSESKEYGYTWYLYCDHKDGEGFEHLINGKYMLIRAGTIIFFSFFFSVRNTFVNNLLVFSQELEKIC